MESIQEVIERNSRMVCQQNTAGQTPLHIAVHTGVSLQVVNVLLECYPEAASIQDWEGETPLHYACSIRPQLEVAQALCNASPQSVNLEDAYGTSALEYAIFAQATTSVVNVLHRTSQNHWGVEHKQLLNNSSPLIPSINIESSPRNNLIARAA